MMAVLILQRKKRFHQSKKVELGTKQWRESKPMEEKEKAKITTKQPSTTTTKYRREWA